MKPKNEPDPLWAVRWGKRTLKLLLALVLLAVAAAIVWRVLPLRPSDLRLEVSTNAEVYADGKPLGSGRVVLDREELIEIGVEVPSGSDSAVIAERLHPGCQFQGPVMMSADDLWNNTGGTQLFMRDAGGSPIIRRVWVFALDEDTWLAVPLEFRDGKRVLSDSSSSEVSIEWDLKWPPSKQRTETRIAVVEPRDGDPPAEDEFYIGAIALPGR
ncbi:MAG: hypothetical protein KDB68_02555 [Planctomycetes bacterium]|nr:hypothetical protein [Planctomycetota bacterium]